jgi:hypothetical protein
MAPDVPVADDELLLDAAADWLLELLELLLEHPAITTVPTTVAASATAAAFPGRRRAADGVSPVPTFRTNVPPQ